MDDFMILKSNENKWRNNEMYMPGMFVCIILKYSSAIAKTRVPGDMTELDRLSVKPVLQSMAQVFLDFRTSGGTAKKIPNNRP